MQNQLSAASIILGTGVVSSSGDNFYVNGTVGNIGFINAGDANVSGSLGATGSFLYNQDLSISGALQSYISTNLTQPQILARSFGGA